jgi:hypothetical protein
MGRVRKAGSAAGVAAAGGVLDPEAARLLAAMGSGDARARPDPLDADVLILRRARGGVSLGGGRYRRAAGDALVAADLAAWDGASLVPSPAGRARLRRAAALPGEAFLAQHLEIVPDTVDDGTGATAVRRDAAENPLAWLRRRRDREGRALIGAAAFEAGERLRRDFTAAAFVPRVTADWGAVAVDGGGPRDPAAASDRVVAARQRVRAALDAAGDDFAGLLIDLCGFLKGIETVERERGWPPRSGKVVATMALARLARHYGLGDEASGPERARSRLWRAPPERE